MITTLMMIFTNTNSSYPVCGLEDNISDVCYRIGPKGWMDQTLFLEFCAEPKVFQDDVHGSTKVIWVHNCMGHNITLTLTNVLIAKHPILKYLLSYCTNLYQLADTFIIFKIKDT